MNAKFDDVDHSVVAFYGFQAPPNAVTHLYSKALIWSDRFDCPFDLIGIDRSKLRRFKGTDKKIRAGLIVPAQLELCSVSKGAADKLEGTDLSLSFLPHYHLCYVNFRSSILSLESETFLEIAEELIELLAPCYGVGFHRIHSWGPSYFALGLGCGGAPKGENDHARSWGILLENQLFLNGFLGGVFPWNFLTKPQLSIIVGGLPLKSWITQNPIRGALQSMPRDMLLWHVSPDHVAHVRKVLYDAGVIFDYDRDVVAHMRQYRRSHRDVIEHLRSDRPLTRGPELPPLKPGELLGKVLDVFGYESAEEARVLKVEKPGEAREVPSEEVDKHLRKSKRSKRK